MLIKMVEPAVPKQHYRTFLLCTTFLTTETRNIIGNENDTSRTKIVEMLKAGHLIMHG